MEKQKVCYRYNESFKLQVIEDIEPGKNSIRRAHRPYGIVYQIEF